MKTFILAAAAASTLALGSTVANADPGEGGFSSDKPFSHALIYYNGWRQQVGYEVTYCDGTTGRELQPGQNIIYVEIVEGQCVLDPFGGSDPRFP